MTFTGQMMAPRWISSAAGDALVFEPRAGETNLVQLAEMGDQRAEAAVCPLDGSSVFTSARDGDPELYRIDADGRNLRRLTHAVGYDGGAAFDRDCSHIVWQAWRPRPGPEREEYLRLIGQAQGHGRERGKSRMMLRTPRLELWVANADGSDPVQVTYLDAMSSAPSFFPGQARIVFSSDLVSSSPPDPGGAGRAERDLFAIDVSGANLERLTTAPGFDGFPVFSPDGKELAFTSARASPAGARDTNVFIANWRATPVLRSRESAADRILADVRYLADPERQGRGIGTPGLEAAATYLEARLQRLGLEPAGVGGSYRQPFEVRLRLRAGAENFLTVGGRPVLQEDAVPAGFSGAGAGVVNGQVILAGYGIVDPAAGLDDYAGLDVRGKIVLVRRFAPTGGALADPAAGRAAGDVRRKAFLARERGALALLVVDTPVAAPTGSGGRPADEAPLPVLRVEGGPGDAGLPVLFVRRRALAASWARLERGEGGNSGLPVRASLRVALESETATACNVAARIRSTRPAAERLPGVVLLGAHYDHLGMGEAHSMDPDSHRIHPGADDNASGSATLLEVARILMGRRASLRRDVVVVAFSGEEAGVLGSTEFVRRPPGNLQVTDLVAMVNLDMVGRLRGNRATVLGRGSAAEWPALLDAACGDAGIDCGAEPGASGADQDGYGPSDQMPFFAARVPVAHFFTGIHPDYHRPSDTPDKVNAAGAAQVAAAAASLLVRVADRATPLTLVASPRPPPGTGDLRSSGASLGSIPDYAGPSDGSPGMLLAGVRRGGAAELGGLQRGDLLVRLGTHQIRSVEDLMYALADSRPGDAVVAVVRRQGAELALPVRLQGPASAPAPAEHPPAHGP
jgi:GNAT superfamily N-acetyltransferase